MIWEIEDFKRIENASLELESGRLTVLTGTNSSGKSSIIQSLLLVAQTVHGQSELILNGPLVRLGDAKDLVRADAINGAVKFGLKTKMRPDRELKEAKSVSVIYEMIPTDEKSKLRAREITVVPSWGKGAPLVIARKNGRKSDVDEVLKITEDFGSRDVLPVKSMMNSEGRFLRTYVVTQGLRALAIIQLKRPQQIETKYKSIVRNILKEEESTNGILGIASRSTFWFLMEFTDLLTPVIHGDLRIAG